MLHKIKLSSKIIIGVLPLMILGFAITIGLIISKSSDLQEEGVLQNARSLAKSHALEIESEIEHAMNAARLIGQLSENFERINIGDRREILKGELRTVIEKNPKFLAVWTAWEPNILDGRDDAGDCQVIQLLDGFLPRIH